MTFSATTKLGLVALTLTMAASTADAQVVGTMELIGAALTAQFNFGNSSQGPAAPSSRYTPQLFNQPKASGGATDPFADRSGTPVADMLGSDDKARALSYLKKSRQSLNEGDLLAAEAWFHKAAGVNVKFSPEEDSPAKLAGDLRRAGVDPRRLVPQSRQAPQETFSTEERRPSGNDAIVPAGDPGNWQRGPFADRMVQSPDVAAQGDRSGMLAQSGDNRQPSRFSEGAPQANGGPLEGAPSPQKMLHQARQALAANDLRAASTLADQAGRTGATFEPLGDSPQKVRTLIDRHHRTIANGPAPEGTPQRRAQADLFMEEADGLLQYSDLDTAEKLARQAQGLNVNFGPFDRTPNQLLGRITALREQQRGGREPQNGIAQVSGQQPAQFGGEPARLPNAIGEPASRHPQKDEAVALLSQARDALNKGDLDQAERLAQTARSMNIPDAAFGPQDERPWMVIIDVERARRHRGNSAPPRGEGDFPVQQGVFMPQRENSFVAPAQAVQPLDGGQNQLAPTVDRSISGNDGERLVAEGEKALQDRQLEKAVSLFRQAWKYEAQLDSFTRHRLRTYLSQMQTMTPREGGSPEIQAVEAQQLAATQQLFSDVGQTLRTAERMREADPKGAIVKLKQLRETVAQSQVKSNIRDQELSRIDRAIMSLERYVADNLPQIEQDERNQQVQASVDQDRETRLEVQQKLAELVEEFNRLLDEHQFAEAEAVAKQARELAPHEPVVQTLLWKSRFVRRLIAGQTINEAKENNFVDAMLSVDESSVPFDDRDPLRFPDVRYWQDLTETRRRRSGDQSRRMSEADAQITRALKTKVDVRFNERPLSEVIHALAAAAGVNVHLDRQGLAAEGITSDQPVTINLQQPISLESALNLILRELRLSYVVQDEVLKITSSQMRDSDVYTKVYNVADLVIPIPNFTPSYNIGLADAIRQAHASLGMGWVGGQMNNVPLQVANNAGPAHLSPLALGQMGAGNGARSSTPVGFGPGGLSGGAQPDFDSLVDLISSTVAPTTWDEVGGPGSVVGFETNLSLVISQTQDVHDEIVDLLEQLRRLQDLQVTIEVRFITLNDNFFERIGVDFDFNINSGVTQAMLQDGGPSVTIGLDPTAAVPTPTANFDVEFRQNSFGSTVPQFGGFDPATAANIGFAILGEIEAFFIIQAAQGDSRTNVMQAPKVTLFNGQQAYVSDTSQTPFVTSVIPVVGDFAAAHQPVIVVLTEGTSLSVQAVVSNDRRFVRLTLVPFFSKIGEVKEFTFNGRRSTSKSNTSVDPDAPDGGQTSEEEDEFIEGTTVQLPTFSFVTVTTTVSVPDGGTVLLGGVKRLSEGRTERGVPVLNKLPYINRLFKNVGIGRETQSLMMMVTPRIIIQEEEEEKLGISGFGTGSP